MVSIKVNGGQSNTDYSHDDRNNRWDTDKRKCKVSDTWTFNSVVEMMLLIHFQTKKEIDRLITYIIFL